MMMACMINTIAGSNLFSTSTNELCSDEVFVETPWMQTLLRRGFARHKRSTLSPRKWAWSHMHDHVTKTERKFENDQDVGIPWFTCGEMACWLNNKQHLASATDLYQCLFRKPSPGVWSSRPRILAVETRVIPRGLAVRCIGIMPRTSRKPGYSRTLSPLEP